MNAENINMWLITIQSMYEMYKKMIRRKFRRQMMIKLLIQKTTKHIRMLKYNQSKTVLLIKVKKIFLVLVGYAEND